MTNPTQTNPNKDIARRYIDEVWNHGRLELVDELVAEDYRGQTHGAGQPVREGREGVKKWVGGLHAAFPDGSKILRSLVAEGDRVVAEVSFSGTHAASGRRVSNEQVYVYELQGGRIVREAVYFDVSGTLSAVKQP